MKGRVAVIGGIKIPLATTARSIGDAGRSGKQREFYVIADGISDEIRKKHSWLTRGGIVQRSVERTGVGLAGGASVLKAKRWTRLSRSIS